MNENFKDLKVNIYSLIQKQISEDIRDEYVPYEEETTSCLKKKLKRRTKVYVRWERVLLTALLVMNVVFLSNQNKLISSVNKQSQSLSTFSVNLKSLFTLYSQLKSQKDTIIIRELHFFNQGHKRKKRVITQKIIKEKTLASNIVQQNPLNKSTVELQKAKSSTNEIPEIKVNTTNINENKLTPEQQDLFSEVHLKPKTVLDEKAILKSKATNEVIIITPSKKIDSSLKVASNKKKEGEYTYQDLLEQSKQIYKNRTE